MSEKNGSSGEKPDVAALREDIRQTRAELGETVQALAAKADVKARAREQVEQTKQRARSQVHDATERVREVAATAAAAATGKVRSATAQAGDKVALAAGSVRETTAQAGDRVRESGVLDKAQEARAQVRRSPVPFAVVLAAGVALVGIILIVRGRRK
jgi:cobalamin biosynthesis Mg chelatase CobN